MSSFGGRYYSVKHNCPLRRDFQAMVLMAVLVLGWATLGFAAAPDALSVNGVTLVPLRYIAEWLGALVRFDDEHKVVVLTLGSSNVELQIGTKRAWLNGDPVEMATPIQSCNGATYVPLRFVAEGLAAGVEWDKASKMVKVYRPTTRETLTLSVKRGKPPKQPVSMKSSRPRDGGWTGLDISFVVANGGRLVRDIQLHLIGCEPGLLALGVASVKGGRFEKNLGYASIEGTFTSATTARGTFEIPRPDFIGVRRTWSDEPYRLPYRSDWSATPG